MLLETRRKRARGAMGVFPAVEMARVRRLGRGAASGAESAVEERRAGVPAPHRPVATAVAPTATSLMLASPSDLGPPVSSARPPPPPSTGGSSPASSSSLSRNRAVDRRVLLSRASRMQALVLDRLRSLDLRRDRRCELLDEILRLKKVMQELHEEVDATTRTVESMERLVLHLTQLSTESPTPSRTTENVPRLEALRRLDDTLRSQVCQPRATKERRSEDYDSEAQRRLEDDSSGGTPRWGS